MGDRALSIQISLTVVAGPHSGLEFRFDGHDTFVVGLASDCHFRPTIPDPYLAPHHCLFELNGPRGRVIDLNSRTGIKVNGHKIESAELADGDEVRVGQTVFRLGRSAPTDTPSVPPNSPGRREIPGYIPKKEIGRGALGTVYMARRVANNERVAIELILAAEGISSESLARFVKSASLPQLLRHSNVVTQFDSGRGDSLAYIVSEYVNGPTAQQLAAKRGPFNARVGVLMMIQALTGLHHAHAHRVIHGDLKPVNLLVATSKDKKRTVKVANFGLARAFDESGLGGSSLLGDVPGSLLFLPPERLTRWRDASPAGDQYSAAATLYYLLTGQFVYDLPPNVPAALTMLLTEAVVPIRQRRNDVPEPLAAIIQKSLAREPAERFTDVAAMRRELEKALASGIA